MDVNSLPWYYAPDLDVTTNALILREDEWHHAHHVLRLAEGDPLIFFDGKGLCAEGVITLSRKNAGEARLTRNLTDHFTDPRTYRISIGVAPTKNIDRIEFAVEKMTELGVHSIGFLKTQFGERSHLRLDRMEKIVISASKQSKKISMPLLYDFMTPVDWVRHGKTVDPNVITLACHLDSLTKPLANTYITNKNVLMLIGPEGGFSGLEMEQLASEGVEPITLGPFRLRVETAAIAACQSIHVLNDNSKRL